MAHSGVARLRLHSWALSTSDLKQALAQEGAVQLGEDATRRELVDAAASAFPGGVLPPRPPMTTTMSRRLPGRVPPPGRATAEAPPRQVPG